MLVLDEATAAVDTATDDRIQHTIRSPGTDHRVPHELDHQDGVCQLHRAHHRTQAQHRHRCHHHHHRVSLLNTWNIHSSGGDTVLVLDRGELVEQGSPTALMEEPSTQFHGMARAAGILN